MNRLSKYPMNLLEDIFGREIDFELAGDFDGTLEYVLHTLNERERDIVLRRYKDKKTYEQCSKPYGVTRQRIRQIETKALKKLKYREEMLQYGIEKYIDFIKAIKSVPNLPIEAINLSCRIYSCLKRSGIDTIGQLIQLEPEQLAQVRNLGKKAYREIVDKLVVYGVDTHKYAAYMNEL